MMPPPPEKILDFPQIVLPNGSHEYGPISISDKIAKVSMSIDRTLPSGLNSSATTTIDLMIWMSYDSGDTWELCVGTRFEGGEFHGHAPDDDIADVSLVSADIYAGHRRKVKVSVDVTGGPVAVGVALLVVYH